MLLRGLFWGSLAGLAWTHLGYPVVSALAAKALPDPVDRDDEHLPTVSVIVAAHDEETVIVRRQSKNVSSICKSR